MDLLIDQNISYRIGNASTKALSGAIIKQTEQIRAFLDNDELDCLEIH
jgi:predicted nuclease of predicted toxin-antitoxin system